jgi:CRISPR-associated protein Cas2
MNDEVKDKRYVILTIYDIVDNRRRYRMVKCLERYGIRVQKSAFEAYLSKVKYRQMVQECVPIIDCDKDSLRIYFLSVHTLVKSWGIGDFHNEDIVIF